MKRIISDREKVLRAKYPQITDEEWELIVEGLKKMSFEQVMAHIMKNGPEVDGIITALEEVRKQVAIRRIAGLN